MLDVLYRDGYDAVVVDVTATALPVSTVAKKLLTGAYGVELHKIGMSNPYTNGILKTSGGKPGRACFFYETKLMLFHLLIKQRVLNSDYTNVVL